MKRFVAAAFTLLALLGCSDQTTPPLNADIRGTNDLVVVGDLIFVVATDRSELKAFNLKATPVRDFVRAPNPLEPLGIPVVRYPVEVAKDVGYADGVEISGPYVYARSQASADISIVGGNLAMLSPADQL